MTIIKTAFDELLKKKGVPARQMDIEDGHHLYSFQFQLNQVESLDVEIILQKTDVPYCDAQVVYRQVYMLSDYNKRGEALEIINELNEMKTGYYSLHLAGDGEIFLRTLLRASADPQPLYETVVFGAGIANGVQKHLTQTLGKSAQK